jgi:hypothetical protein
MTKLTEWSRAQLKAALELDGRGQRLVDEEELAKMRKEDRPPAARGCICTNGHQPDKDGCVFTSPSCEVHNFRTPYIAHGRLTERDARTVGVIHSSRSREL